ncbi:MAG: dephospho-CoA kinase [Pseudomonadota bacterium]|nr:dephospho-CoA kinase [Pseudomonadota bacterium]
MNKIGITGSLSSGKSTASKILGNKGPLFSADSIVKKLYSQKKFRKYISKELKIKSSSNLKSLVKQKILNDKSFFKKLEKIIHPLVRKEMIKFIKKHKNKKFIFFEIPLLVESRLMKYFDTIFFIKAKRNLRLKRFKKKGGNNIFFNILDKKQLSEKKKVKHCDHVIVNEKNINILKKRLLDIIKKYE